MLDAILMEYYVAAARKQAKIAQYFIAWR